jgi:hypothetical protein
MPMKGPTARRDSLVVEKVKNETLVYDSVTHQALCLNETASLVWENCDGVATVDEIAERVASVTNAQIDTFLVWHALGLLERNHLLVGEFKIPAAGRLFTRRDVIKKVGLVGAAATIPVILAVTTPTPAMAQTCIPDHGGCTPNGSDCTTNLQCCSCRCNLGSGNPKCVS